MSLNIGDFIKLFVTRPKIQTDTKIKLLVKIMYATIIKKYYNTCLKNETVSANTTNH